MKPPNAAAAWMTGVLIDASISRAPSSRTQSSAVIDHGQPGSSNFQRCASNGPNTAILEKSILRFAMPKRKARWSFVNRSPMALSPAAIRLISPFATGTLNDADFVTPFSLASASILKRGNVFQRLGTSSGITGLNLTVESCWSPTTRRARVMIPAPSRSNSGVS